MVSAITNVFSWQNSVSLCAGSFCTPRPNLPVIPDIFWLPICAFQSPMMKKVSFLVLVQESLVGLHRTVNFSFFGVSGWGIDLDYCDVECFAFKTNWDHSVVFKVAPKYYISDSFVDYEGYSISSKKKKGGRMSKNWCLWTVVLERLLRVPWTERRSKQSILVFWF